MSYQFLYGVKLFPAPLVYIFFLFLPIFLKSTEILASTLGTTCEGHPKDSLQKFNSLQRPEYLPGGWSNIKELTHLKYSSSINPEKIWGGNTQTTSWMCGYSFSVKIPETIYSSEYAYPLIIFLHGGLTSRDQYLRYLGKAFYASKEDPYILVIPKKQEWDWNADKLKDVIELVSSKIKIDPERIYLTGLSMGGRGTFIVGAALPNLFAALMPLSPHHAPYSYIPLASQVEHLPIWLSHGTADRVSNFNSAQKMFQTLKKAGATVHFNRISGGKHCCWEELYGNKTIMEWLLNQRIRRGTAVRATTWGTVKSKIDIKEKNGNDYRLQNKNPKP